ncbi:MAG: glycosyltransferase family 39 protein [Alphaproteobacteria bacterium]|nr:glycosyltransferase family 39 protein [Alphaproteobacteria bacterium]
MIKTEPEKNNAPTPQPHKINTGASAAKIVLILQILLGLNLIFTICQMFGSSLNMADDVEHLRAAYFVSLGDVPYRDFFEHHHPLLWYILAPLVAILPHNTATALFVGRIICFGVSLITGWFIYKMEKKFIGNKICALLCLNLYFLVFDNITFSGLFQVKPDIFQRCCFFIGLYYLFGYFHYHKFRDLQIAAVAFTLSFLFLQTVALSGALLAIPLIFFLSKYPQKWPDLPKAALLPLAMLGVGAYALWRADCLPAYYELNWQLNSLLVKMWFSPTIVTLLPFVLVLLAAITAIISLIRRKKISIFRLSVALLFAGELVRCIFTVRSVQHYLPMLIFAAMIAAPLICRKKSLFKAFFGFTALYIIFAVSDIPQPLTKSVPFALMDKTEYGLTITPGGVFAKRPAYYWSHIPAETFHDIYFHSVADYDINELNRQYPQELVFYFPDWSPFEYLVLENALDSEQQKVMKKHFIGLESLQDYQKIGAYAYIRKH